MSRTGHPSKPWFQDATEGQRVYRLPPELATFTMEPQMLQGLGALVNKGDLDKLRAELETDVWDKVDRVQPLLQEVAKYNQSAYADLSKTYAGYLLRADALQAPLDQGTLDTSAVAAWRLNKDDLSRDLTELEPRVSEALRAGASRKETNAVLWTSTALLLAGAVSWYVLSKMRRSRRR